VRSKNSGNFAWGGGEDKKGKGEGEVFNSSSKKSYERKGGVLHVEKKKKGGEENPSD